MLGSSETDSRPAPLAAKDCKFSPPVRFMRLSSNSCRASASSALPSGPLSCSRCNRLASSSDDSSPPPLPLLRVGLVEPAPTPFSGRPPSSRPKPSCRAPKLPCSISRRARAASSSSLFLGLWCDILSCSSISSCRRLARASSVSSSSSAGAAAAAVVTTVSLGYSSYGSPDPVADASCMSSTSLALLILVRADGFRSSSSSPS
mmetsp:Transcript_34827/g.76211  ORF Transcript_34827/g.76211 Transcript_34827/m.76211 type:complete len:204 (+) Transcript_34827:2364-2975(+)